MQLIGQPAARRLMRIGGHRRPAGVVAACVLACLGFDAAALDWDASQFKAYGGTYAADCANPAALRLHVLRDRLVAERGAKRLEGRGVKSAVSYFGNQPPPKDFQTELLSQAGARGELNFGMYRDARGRYARFDADARLRAEVGVPANSQARYRDCDTGRAANEGARASAPGPRDAAPARADSATTGSSPLASPRFRTAYARAYGPKLGQAWIAKLDGPSRGIEQIDVDGQRYLMYGFCKPHDCQDNNTVLIYARHADLVYGYLLEGGSRTTVLGAPPPALAAELRRLWQREFRQGR